MNVSSKTINWDLMPSLTLWSFKENLETSRMGKFGHLSFHFLLGYHVPGRSKKNILHWFFYLLPKNEMMTITVEMVLTLKKSFIFFVLYNFGKRKHNLFNLNRKFIFWGGHKRFYSRYDQLNTGNDRKWNSNS